MMFLALVDGDEPNTNVPSVLQKKTVLREVFSSLRFFGGSGEIVLIIEQCIVIGLWELFSQGYIKSQCQSARHLEHSKAAQCL